MSSLNTIVFSTVILFSLFTLILFVVHEQQAILNVADYSATYLKKVRPAFTRVNRTGHGDGHPDSNILSLLGHPLPEDKAKPLSQQPLPPTPTLLKPTPTLLKPTPPVKVKKQEKVGTLMCNGKNTKSEVIYWKIVPGDNEYESPITPHHGNHHDRYLTFEYDNGGWNNMRMAIECLIVSAHAMGRTVVLPPSQHLYLLTTKHKDKGEDKMNSEMGFEDFFELDLLKSHKGFHVITMKEFLEKEALVGGLHGKKPPDRSSDLWGPKLWHYLESVADEMPIWGGRFVGFPARPDEDFNLTDLTDAKTLSRIAAFGGKRTRMHYDERLQQAHHIHFPGREKYRVLQHHYGKGGRLSSCH
jgi:hypothetical protein